MSNEQLAHDLAIAKLCGSTLPTDKLVEEYHNQFTEIKDFLLSQDTHKNTKIRRSPY